jgi:5-(carboxyamino)imidazole ribonucleotide mutase
MKIAVIMGSASDWDVMAPCCTTLDEFGVSYEKKVLSAHRNPGPLADYIVSLKDKGCEVVIAGAGGAAPQETPCWIGMPQNIFPRTLSCGT